MSHRCRMKLIQQGKWKGTGLDVEISKCKCGAYQFIATNPFQPCPNCHKSLNEQTCKFKYRNELFIVKDITYPICYTCFEKRLEDCIEECFTEKEDKVK